MNKKVLSIFSAVVIVALIAVMIVIFKDNEEDDTEISVSFTDESPVKHDVAEDSEKDKEETSVVEEKSYEDMLPRDVNGHPIDEGNYVDESTYTDYGEVERSERTGGISAEDYNTLQNITDEERRMSEQIFENEEGAAPY